jgi:serpin B
VGLYHRLGGGRDGNLFFSPYSVFAVLAMTAEGARGETAGQMGEILQLPATLRGRGAAAAERPWDFAPVHAGLGALVRVRAASDAGGPPGARARLDSLRAAFERENQEALRLRDEGDWEGARAANGRASALAAQVNELGPRVDRYELRVANAIWGDAARPPRPGFLATLARHYGTGGFWPIGFRTEPEAARLRINAWVADETRQRIRDLLPPGCIDTLTRLVLTNAIYFKGEWDEVFSTRDTRTQPFRLANGDSAQVALMHKDVGAARYAAFRADGSLFPTPRTVPAFGRQTAEPLYPDAAGFQVAEIPYKGGDLSMVIVLPRSPAGLAAIERVLSATALSRWIGQMEECHVSLWLPRFRLEGEYELRTALRSMGMVRAFDPMAAQLDGMLEPVRGAASPFISAVFHKSFVEVNEKGTEAAAATAVMVAAGSILSPRTVPFVPEFRSDRPFLFLIRDTRTGCILFMGRLARP